MENWTLKWTKLTYLSKDNVNIIPENIPGVYRLSFKSTDSTNNTVYYVFYVGKSNDIKKRMLEHLSESEENEGIRNYVKQNKCFFKYAQISEEYIRCAAEKQMYFHFEPSWNKVIPEGRDDVKVNLN